ncbi:MAG: hypothetical protein ISR99_03030 [Parcubacteria group bacterium]|nr:hypothetical protein [Parcubacteria group bacterium]
MFSDAWKLIKGDLSIILDEAKTIYEKVMVVLFIVIALAVLAVMINVNFGREWNYIILFAGSLWLLILGLSPVSFGAGAITGTTIAFLQDADLSQGAASGLQLTLKIVVGVMFWFLLVLFFLSTWSFASNPSAIFPAAAASLFLATAMVHFGIKSNGILRLVAVLYALVVLATAMWSTLTKENWESLGLSPENSAKVAKVSVPTMQRVGKSCSGQAEPQDFVVELRPGEVKKVVVVDCYGNSTPHIKYDGWIADFAGDKTCFSVMPEHENEWLQVCPEDKDHFFSKPGRQKPRFVLVASAEEGKTAEVKFTLRN